MPRRPPIAAGALLFLFSCADEGAATTRASAPAVVEGERSTDPRVVAARRAVTEGRLDLARRLVDQIGESAGVEGTLLFARVAALARDDTEASRRIEEARRVAPGDARVYATSAELHAAAGRLETADAEILRGIEACGETGPELMRARGVHLISMQGGAEAGLALLQSALELDPELPFTSRATGQAHLLVGKAAMASNDLKEAYDHAVQSLAFDPGDVDARRFQGDVLVAAGDLEGAIEVFEPLLAEGEPMDAELAVHRKNAGFLALLNQERDKALRHFRRARELGLSDEQLGTGRHALDEEATRLVGESRAAYDAGEVERAESLALEALAYSPSHEDARERAASYAVHRALEALQGEKPVDAERHLRVALERDASSLEARNFLGHALFKLERFEEAAEAWRVVVETARAEELTLPDPVHLSLARAHYEAGDVKKARGVLRAYLGAEPTGEYVGETRTLLEALPEDGE